MINLSYNLSLDLEKNLAKVDDLRQKVLLTPLSSKAALNLRWEATVSHIFYGLNNKEQIVSKTDIVRVLGSGLKKYSQPERRIIQYKAALDYIYASWLATSRSVEPRHILELYNIISGNGVKKKHEKFDKSLKLIDYFLDYLQRYPEKPVVQAAIAHIEILDLEPFDDCNYELGCLVDMMFLYKWGYDFRGFLAMEEFWHLRRLTFGELVDNTKKSGRIKEWLEFYVAALCESLEKIAKKAESLSFKGDTVSLLFELNIRQKDILKYLEVPYAKITNRNVQRLFSVSQITASRDLNGLVRLGLLFAHGKGRSVYYTRV